MKESNLEHWGDTTRHFLRETPQPGNQSREIRITSAQLAEFRAIRAESVAELTEKQNEWGAAQMAVATHTRTFSFTSRGSHVENCA